MLKRIIARLPFFFLIFVVAEAAASTRTVQFSGTASAGAGAFATQPGSSHALSMAQCQVTVMNTGQAVQVVDEIYIWAYEFADGVYKTVQYTPVADQKQCLLLPLGGTACPNTCLKQDLPKGGICQVVFDFPVLEIADAHRSAICAGVVTVKDKDPAIPGSVIASGSLAVNQEAMVLGGELVGVYKAGKNVNETNCMSVCQARGGVAWDCGLWCGKTSPAASMGIALPVHVVGRYRPVGVRGNYLRLGSANGSTNNNGLNFDLTGIASGQTDIRGGAYITQSPNFSTVRPIVFDAAVDPAYPAGDTYIYGGFDAGSGAGLMYQVNMGTRSELCNPTAVGGLDCNYSRTAQSDLLLRVGSSSSFPINGSMPF